MSTRHTGARIAWAVSVPGLEFRVLRGCCARSVISASHPSCSEVFTAGPQGVSEWDPASGLEHWLSGKSETWTEIPVFDSLFPACIGVMLVFLPCLHFSVQHGASHLSTDLPLTEVCPPAPQLWVQTYGSSSGTVKNCTWRLVGLGPYPEVSLLGGILQDACRSPEELSPR